MANTIRIPSATDPDKTYQVCLTENRCECRDWINRRAPGCPQAGTDCKHLVQARAERFAHFAALAGTLEDGELARLIAKYRGVPGRGLVLLALLTEAFDREQLAKELAKPLTKPSLLLPAVLANARAWGREMRDARLKAVFA